MNGDSLTFLGTGGARFMIISQQLSSGGIWLKLNGTEILLDPGPGCIVHSNEQHLKPENLAGIILSHRHLDHSADINIMVEAMTHGGFQKHGFLFAPGDAFGPEPVLFSYLRKYLEGVQVLEEGKSYSIGNIGFTTPLKHIHSVETYGMVFHTPDYSFAYIADSRFFEPLCQTYKADILLINVLFMEPIPPTNNPLTPTEHLSVPDAGRIIAALKPKVALLTHFGPGIFKANPATIAERLSNETGVKVIAAKDGMTFDLSFV